jgi:hypothetical protein
VLTFRYGGRKGRRYKLNFRDDLLAVRTYSRAVVCTRRPFESSALDSNARALLKNFDLVARFDEAGVEVLRAPAGPGVSVMRRGVRSNRRRMCALPEEYWPTRNPVRSSSTRKTCSSSSAMTWAPVPAAS